jgi:hypothetical protein
MSHKIILFNGPPRSGKDTAAKLMIDRTLKLKGGGNYGYAMDRFSMPLKTSLFSLFGTYIGGDLGKEIEATKEKPMALLGGLSFREAQIDLSEKYLKPLYGKDCFGEWLAFRLHKQIELSEKYNKVSICFLIPDSGFSYEAVPVVEYMGSDNVLLVRMHRDGTDFSNDSRSYIELPDVTTVDILNNGSLDDLAHNLYRHVDTWLK